MGKVNLDKFGITASNRLSILRIYLMNILTSNLKFFFYITVFIIKDVNSILFCVSPYLILVLVFHSI